MCKGNLRKGKDLEGGCYVRPIVNTSGSITGTGAAIVLMGVPMYPRYASLQPRSGYLLEKSVNRCEV